MLDAGIIGSDVFSALLLMAVVTTAFTVPLVRLSSRFRPSVSRA
jgi:hypothetical protein